MLDYQTYICNQVKDYWTEISYNVKDNCTQVINQVKDNSTEISYLVISSVLLTKLGTKDNAMKHEITSSEYKCQMTLSNIPYHYKHTVKEAV